jgi:hypothetical protein
MATSKVDNKKEKRVPKFDKDGNPLTVMANGKEVKFDKKFQKSDKSRHYVNNKDMLIEVKKSQAQGKMTDELAKMSMLLCQKMRYSSSGNYSSYSFFDDMVSAALLNISHRVWNRFDCSLYTNVYGYFSMSINNSYRAYLKLEKRQRMARDGLLAKSGQGTSYAYQDEYRKELQDSMAEDMIDTMVNKEEAFDWSKAVDVEPQKGLVDLNESEN